jgi:hypothetical protein
MKQITQLIEVMLVGRGGDQAVGQVWDANKISS